MLAENRDYLRFMEEGSKILRFYLTKDNNDARIYNALKKLIDKSANFSSGLKETLIELEALDLLTVEDKNDFLNKNSFEIDIKVSFNRYKKEKKENKNFIVGLICVESLRDILLNHGYSSYIKAFRKVMSTIKSNIGKDDAMAIIDNNTFGILYEVDNSLKLKKLKDRISNLEMRVDKTFETLKVRICGTMPRTNDEDAEKLILRLYGLLYEIRVFRDRDFIFE